MSALITSRTSSLRGLLSSLTTQPVTKFSCGSCRNGSTWRKLGHQLGLSPTTSKFQNGSLSNSRSFASGGFPEAVRTTEIAVEDMDREAKETANRVAKGGQQRICSVDELLENDPTLRSPDYFQVHNLFTVRDLYDARVHLGHKVGSLNPSMNDFIFGTRFDSVIFDLDKTAFHLRQALNFTAHVAYRKGIILFVTRSPHTINLVEQTAIECGEYAHCRDWHTHIMTNSENKFGGITRLPDLVILFNTLDTVMATHKAVFDANKMLIPTVGIVDSNCNPNQITFPVPGNDDTLCSIQFYCKVFKEAILRGKQKRRSLENQQQQEQTQVPK